MNAYSKYATYTDGTHGRFQVVGTVTWHEEFEKIRL